MTLSYSLVGSETGNTLTLIFSDGEVQAVPSTHVNFDQVVQHLLTEVPADEARVRELVNLVETAKLQLTQLSDRVSVAGNVLYFDDEPIDDRLSQHIVRLIGEGDGNAWQPFVNFLEKLATNPSKESQQSLYNWIADRNLTIAENGDFIAYKGVQANGDSISSGLAYVNGLEHNGHIPNLPGTVISVPRSYVDADTSVGCSKGLHAGTWEYASNFARGQILEVRINPRDVVSVPDDCSHQKLRVCRYTVISATDHAYEVGTVYDDVEDDDDSSSLYECDECGLDVDYDCTCDDDVSDPSEDDDEVRA